MKPAHLLALVALLAMSACCHRPIRREVCDRYVACAKAADPAAAAPVVESFGPGSACWADDHQARACVEGCEAGIESLKSNGVKCEETNR